MERQDLSQILLKDTDCYYKYSIYCGFLKRNNINTVEQLVAADFEGNTFNGHKLQKNTASRLRSFVTLLKHEYLGEPLLYDAYLDKEIDIDRSRSGPLGVAFQFAEPTARDYEVKVADFFGCDYCFPSTCVEKFLREKVAERNERVSKHLPQEPVKVIDFFNWVVTKEDEFEKYVPASKMYIEEYEKKHTPVTRENESNSLVSLRGQLTTLLRSRKALDEQIDAIQKQIDSMCNDDTKGGVLR